MTSRRGVAQMDGRQRREEKWGLDAGDTKWRSGGGTGLDVVVWRRRRGGGEVAAVVHDVVDGDEADGGGAVAGRMKVGGGGSCVQSERRGCMDRV